MNILLFSPHWEDVRQAVFWANSNHGSIGWKMILLFLLAGITIWNIVSLRHSSPHPKTDVFYEIWCFLMLVGCALFVRMPEFLYLAVLGAAAGLWPIVKHYRNRRGN
ncbi:hypothetical protein [Caproicibacter sp.]|uniref:hypothetical protein n=1 Tax=Caproicibacter sp. TaxID=2814884 RepID=UPI003988EEB3